MNIKRILLFVVIVIAVLILLIFLARLFSNKNASDNEQVTSNASPHPLSIDYLRQLQIEGSEIEIENNLEDSVNYKSYIISYISDGNKIYALMTVPTGEIPDDGFPVIIFNHGYIPPKEYKTTEKYVAYTDYFAKNGYVVIKPDYRGHGDSEGEANGGYGSNGYTIDVLSLMDSVKKIEFVNPEKIGMWGHSMGAFITLRVMVTNSDVKAGVVWGGVVASYPDMISAWSRSTPPPEIPVKQTRWRDTLIKEYGDFATNPKFWNSLSANSYLDDISGPLEIHHAKGDKTVPYSFSENLGKSLEEKNKTVNLFLYEEDDHNISNNFTLAMERSLAFFDKYLK